MADQEQDLELFQDEDGAYSLPSMDELGLDLNLPDIPTLDAGALQEQLARQAEEIGREQVRALRTARAIQLAGVQMQALSEVVNVHAQIKENEPWNQDFVRINVTPRGVYSQQVTPIRKWKEHEINITWD